jgi:nucleoside-diphosphate-sugar epimerase
VAGHEWLPEMARTLGVKPPRRVPRWLARMLAGEAVVMMATESRGATNEKAKRELGWTLRYPSWRQGFAETYGSASNDSGAQAARRAGTPSPDRVERRAA